MTDSTVTRSHPTAPPHATPADSAQYFEAVAGQWDDLRRNLFPDDLRDKALDAVPLRPGAVAADLGAGTGFLSEGLLQRGLRVVAVDRSAAMLAELESRLGHHAGLETRHGSAEDLPLADGEAEFVFANMFLHHVEDPAATLREMARVLAPGGSLVITDLDRHDHEFLRREQHDRWLGFERADVAGWMEAAGLEAGSVRDTEDRCCSTSCCGGDEAKISVFLATAAKPALSADGVSADGASGDGVSAAGGTAEPPGREEALRQAIRRRYAQAARQAASGQTASCGCGCDTGSEFSSPVTRGHYEAEAGELPPDVVGASLGCANPVALAELRPGEAVLDLGSGAGIDLILSARRVGAEGKVYGLDMTDEMLELARRNLADAGVPNVELLRGLIEEIPLPGATVDVVLSNCVLNLTTDKGRALAEAFRVLRPGGRLAVADIVALRPLPEKVRRHAEMWSACVGGALTVEEYRGALTAAGFADVDIEIAATWNAADFGEAGQAALGAAGLTVDDTAGLIASARVRARKA